MSLIDYTYFKGDIKIVSALTTGEYNDDFTALLSEYEDKILVDLLGYDLKAAFISGLAVGSPLQKWLDLRDGKIYTVVDSEGRTVNVKWNGLINAEKRSLLAYFVYYEYMTANYTQPTTTGENKQLAQNSERAEMGDYKNKIINAFNKGIDLYGFDIEGMTGKDAIIKSKSYTDYLLGNKYKIMRDYYVELLKPTAFNFIYAMNVIDSTTYPNWNFTEKKKLNIFGI